MKSFLGWMESEEGSALSEPQHKRGESNMGLDALVERRMKQIIMELESSGKGTQQDILASVQNYLKSKGVKQPPQAQEDQSSGGPQDGSQAGPPQQQMAASQTN